MQDNLIEEWREAFGWEGIYSISNHGRVRRDGKSCGAKVGKITIGYPDGKGYLYIRLYGRPARKDQSYGVHRLVLEAFVGLKPAGMECCHGDGNGLNNRLDNLRWGTPKENAADRELHGNNLRGEDKGTAKLTDQHVLTIRRMIESGAMQKEVAAKFGINQSTVSRLYNRLRWQHLT